MQRVLRLLFALALTVVCVVTLPGAGHADTDPAPVILLDGLPLPFPIPPTIIGGRTMVPFRAVAEALGIQVTWLAESRSIDARKPGTQVYLTIDKRVGTVNGVPVTLDVPPLITESRTLVPLRFFSEVFGARVAWNGETRTVTVVSPVREMQTLAFYAIRSFDERHYVPRFSDVAYGWAVLTAGGRVVLDQDSDYRWPQPQGEISGERLLDEAARSRVRRHLMVHAVDKSGDMTRLILDPRLIHKAAEEVAAVVAGKGFDGVVLDLEYLGQTEQGAELEAVRQGFTSLVRAVATRLRATGRDTIISVHPLNGAFHGYDYAAIAGEADLLQLMAHDYRDGGGPEPPDLVSGAIELTLEHVAPERVLLGIVAPYETAETLVQKAGLAKRYSLAGVSLWRLGTVGEERMAALAESVSRRP